MKKKGEMIRLLERANEHLLKVWQMCNQTSTENGHVSGEEWYWARQIETAQQTIKELQAKMHEEQRKKLNGGEYE